MPDYDRDAFSGFTLPMALMRRRAPRPAAPSPFASHVILARLALSRRPRLSRFL